MNIRSIVLGTTAFFVTSLIITFVFAIPDEALFEETYIQTGELWRGELEENSTFFMSWILHKLIFAAGIAMLYLLVRPSLSGPGWRRSALVSLATVPLICATYLGQWTVFTIPGAIWIWWGVYYTILTTVSGAVMGTMLNRFGSLA